MFDVGVKGSCKGPAKAREVCATVALRNVVGVAVNVFLKGIIPLHGHLNFEPILSLAREMKDPVHRLFGSVEVLDERQQPALVAKRLLLAGPFILQLNANP